MFICGIFKKNTSLRLARKRQPCTPKDLYLARSPDFRIFLLEAPSHPPTLKLRWVNPPMLKLQKAVVSASFVPDNSGGGRTGFSPVSLEPLYSNFIIYIICLFSCQEKKKKIWGQTLYRTVQGLTPSVHTEISWKRME